MKTFTLKVTPYVIALISGLLVYVYAVDLKNPGLNNLLINVAAGLVSVPLVFICYEVVNEICTRKLNNTILDQVIFDINYLVIEMIKGIKISMSISQDINKENFEKFLEINKKDIRKNLKIDKSKAADIKKLKLELLNILYKNSNMEIMPNDQIQTLLTMGKELGIISKELEHLDTSKNRTIIDNAVYNLIQSIGDWSEYTNESSILEHHSFNLIVNN